MAVVLAVSVAGTALWRLDAVRQLDLPARLAIAFVGGTLWLTVVMFAASALGIRWHLAWLAPAILVPSFLARRGAAKHPQQRLVWIMVALSAGITLYGTLTARETCADLLYFWGPKAARFARAAGIDVAYLADAEHLLMHPDYPPLLPLVYAWGAMVAGRLDFWGPLLLTAFLLAGTAAIVRATAGDNASMLMAAVLGYGYAQSLAAGAADPILILFEITALCALTFLSERSGGAVLASVALAAAALTKVEGAAFVLIALAAYALVSRSIRRALAISILPALLLACWLLFVRAHGLLDSYARGGTGLRPDAIGEVLARLGKASSFHLFYLPWIAVLTLLVLGRARIRYAALPLLVAAGALAYTVFFYLHSPDPSAWIEWSGQRVLLTPLAAMVVAGGAAERAASAPLAGGSILDAQV